MVDPGITETGAADARRKAQIYSESFDSIHVAFVSPLLRAAQTALLMLPRCPKIVFAPELAELASDRFAKNGNPVDPATKAYICKRSDEQTGRTRRELECLLCEKFHEKEVGWSNLGPDDEWWNAPPETKQIAKAHIRKVLERIETMPGGIRVAIVGHSYWFKTAVPFASRPKGAPNPLGCAAHYWPQNVVPTSALFHRHN